MGFACANSHNVVMIEIALLNKRALLVQLVERRSPKPDVGGSSPPGRVANPGFHRTWVLVLGFSLEYCLRSEYLPSGYNNE